MRSLLSFIVLMSVVVNATAQLTAPYDSITTIPHGGKVKDMRFDKNGQKLYWVQPGKVERLKLYHLFARSWKVKDAREIQDQQHAQARLSINAKYLVYYRTAHSIYIFKKRWNSYRLKHKVGIPSGEIVGGSNCVAMDPKEKYLAVGSSHGQVTLYNLRTGKVIRVIKTEESGTIASLAFSNNGKKLALGTGASKCIVMDWKANTILHEIKLPYKPFTRFFSSQIPARLEFSEHDDKVYMILHNTEKSLVAWDLTMKNGYKIFRLKNTSKWLKETPYKSEYMDYYKGHVLLGDLGGDIRLLVTNDFNGTKDYLTVPYGKHCKGICLSPDRKALAILGQKTLTIFEQGDPIIMY